MESNEPPNTQINITFPRFPGVSGATAGIICIFAALVLCGIPYNMVEANLETGLVFLALLLLAGFLGVMDNVNRQEERGREENRP